MEEAGRNQGLITTRRAAAFAAIVTGFVGIMTFRAAFFHPVRHPHFHLASSIGFLFPRWALLPLNVAFYAWVVWLCLVFFRAARGKERIVVGGWLPGHPIGPRQKCIPNGRH